MTTTHTADVELIAASAEHAARAAQLVERARALADFAVCELLAEALDATLEAETLARVVVDAHARDAKIEQAWRAAVDAQLVREM